MGKEFKTFETMVLDVLREIEPASMKQITKALNMGSPPYSIMRSLLKKDLVTKDVNVGPNTYSIKEVIVRYDY